jgi:arginase
MRRSRSHALSARQTVNRHYAIIEAPSVLGLRPTGVETLPDALLRAGLATRLRARRAGRVEPPPYDDRRDPETLILNPNGIAEYTSKLADAIGKVLDTDEFPVVLGGDCSIVLGGLLALRRRDRFGLLFVDGHTDFYQPEANINGEAASSDLALATGRGPEILTMFDGYRPLVRDEDVVVLGFRDGEEAASYGSQLPPPDMRTIDLAEVRRSGIEAGAHEALDRLSRNGLAGFWIHLDADALDDGVMPAVDYRLPDGLSFDELEIILETALDSPRAVGLEITIFNPQLDPDGTIARSLVDTLARSMARYESKSG